MTLFTENPLEDVYKRQLVNNMIIADNLHSAIFSLAAYTVILCFSLFKSGALAKSCLLYTSRCV